jgi:hypothetical protein
LVPFSCFARLNSFKAVRRASDPVFNFCAPELIFGCTEGVPSRFNVLRSRTRFGRFRGHQVLFSCFTCPYSFSAVPWASGPVVMFCASGLIFGLNEGVMFRFHVLRSRTRFLRYRGRPFSFSCFALPNSFSDLPRVSCFVLMFYAPGLVFGGAGGVVSCFLILRSRTRLRRFQDLRVPFSYFVLPDSFSAVPRASGPV